MKDPNAMLIKSDCKQNPASTALVRYCYCLLRGWEVMRHFRDLEKSQWLPVKEIQWIQAKKLRTVFRHAYDNVPFYHQKFKEAGVKPEDVRTIADIQKLPITTKGELKAHTPHMTVARNYSVKKLVKGTTGGSTGEPFTFFKDERTIFHELAALSRFRSWYGFFEHRQLLMALLFYYAPWSKEFKLFLQRWLICNRMEQTLWKYAHWTRRFRPQALEGSPVAFYVLARFLEREGLPSITLPRVLSTSETLLASHKKAIELAFNCEIFNHYGCSEIYAMAQECEAHSGLHINSEDRIVEFVKGGQTVSAGEAGELVVTDLENYAMPFIRYNIKDVGEPTDDVCSCGRGLPLIKKIHGRVWDLLISPNGTIIPSDVIAQFILFKDQKWTQEFQVVQLSKQELLIKVVKSPNETTNLDYLIEKLQKHMGNIKLKTEFVESIEPPRSGKHRFIISEESKALFESDQN